MSHFPPWRWLRNTSKVTAEQVEDDFGATRWWRPFGSLALTQCKGTTFRSGAFPFFPILTHLFPFFPICHSQGSRVWGFRHLLGVICWEFRHFIKYNYWEFRHFLWFFFWSSRKYCYLCTQFMTIEYGGKNIVPLIININTIMIVQPFHHTWGQYFIRPHAKRPQFIPVSIDIVA